MASPGCVFPPVDVAAPGVGVGAGAGASVHKWAISRLIHLAHGRSPEHCMCDLRQNRHAESTLLRRFRFVGGAEPLPPVPAPGTGVARADEEAEAGVESSAGTYAVEVDATGCCCMADVLAPGDGPGLDTDEGECPALLAVPE